MNELIAAAKAVIEVWDAGRGVWDQISALRAAVERSENAIKDTDAYEHGYIAGQKAMKAHERERCREIVITMGGPDVPELLRQIDSGEE